MGTPSVFSGSSLIFWLPSGVVNRPSLPVAPPRQPEPEPEKTPRKPRGKVAKRIIAAVVVIVVLVAGYGAFTYVRFLMGVTHVNALVPTTSDLDGKDQNILLVGDDHRPAGASAAQLAQLGTTQDGGGTSTDTMILMHIPADGKKATLISFPRDSWVNIPGYGMRKLNAAFSLGSAKGGDSGGAQLLVKTIQDMTGLTINHYVRVSLLGFYNVAQALGPVTVCLNHAVNDPYSGIDLPAGVSTLNAKQALAFVRQRHGLPDGDLDREIRQQYFLSVEGQKVLSAGTLLNPVKLQNVVDAVSSSIETDPNLDLLSLAVHMRGLEHGGISSATIPVSGTPTIRVGGVPVSIVQVNTAAMPAFIHGIVGGKSGSTATTPAVTPSDVTVTVLNGGGRSGAAGEATSEFAGYGFHTEPALTTNLHAKTTVEYPASMADAANLVATYLPGAVLMPTSGVTSVTVVLGADHIAVTKPTAGATVAPSAPTSTSSTPAAPAVKSYSSATCIN
jgi:LCP family protein required for cell wall assembly